jgi:hypothetical protein
MLCVVTQAQNGFLIVKKGNKTIQCFWYWIRVSHSSKAMDNGSQGSLTKYEKDSFTYTQEIYSLLSNWNRYYPLH